MRLLAALVVLAGLGGSAPGARAALPASGTAAPAARVSLPDEKSLALAWPPSDPTARISGVLALEQEGAAAAPVRRPVPAVLRSLVLPGWGAWHDGHRDIALGFLALEGAAWTTVAVSVGQGHLRKGSSEETAALFAGIDLPSHSDDFRRFVSLYSSSEEYNRLVVYREAAALYYGEPDRYNGYIDQHSLKGKDAWSWTSDEEWARYRQLRHDSERAFQRARFAAAAAVVNRVASAVVAARLSRQSRAAQGAAAPERAGLGGPVWSVDPFGPLGVEHRLAWVLRF